MVCDPKAVRHAVVELQINAIGGIGVVSVDQDLPGQAVAHIRGQVPDRLRVFIHRRHLLRI